jgi:hypothetical protein
VKRGKLSLILLLGCLAVAGIVLLLWPRGQKEPHLGQIFLALIFHTHIFYTHPMFAFLALEPSHAAIRTCTCPSSASRSHLASVAPAS